MNTVHELWRRRGLVGMLSLRNLKIRYKHSVLGFFWSLLTPGLLILIYAIFARILRFSGERPDYLEFLVCGIVVWQFTATCLNDGINAVTGNANLVKKTRFPRVALPLALTLANTVNFLLTAVVLGIFLVCTGVSPGNLLWLGIAFPVHFALCLGVVMLGSAGHVYFRDTQHMIGVGTLAWFFLSPVFYPPQRQLAMLPDSWSSIIYLNPMTGILGMYRSALLGDPSPGGVETVISLACVVLVFGAGWAVFARAQRGFGEVL